MPSLKFEDGALTSWSDELLAGNHFPEAIALLKLNVKLNPESADGYFELGEAYRKSGQKQWALESYQKALEKDPDNEEIQQKLKELQ